MEPVPDPGKRRERAMQQAYGLGITLYLPESGPPQQHPPGELIDPGPRSRPLEIGHDLRGQKLDKFHQ